MSGACATRGNNCIALPEAAEKKLEGTNFVSCTYRRVEIVTLDPQLTLVSGKSLNRRRQIAKVRARQLFKRGEATEKRDYFSVMRGIDQPARLAE